MICVRGRLALAMAEQQLHIEELMNLADKMFESQNISGKGSAKET